MNELCNVSFSIQPHQRFLESAVPYVDRLLLFHGIGSGKTCSSIRIAKGYLNQQPNRRNKIVVVVPASLRDNFYKELQGPCGASMNPDRFDVMSYQGFVKRYKNRALQLNNTLIIVDEIQNVISLTGNMYKVFMEAFQNMTNSKLVCLSATPMFDNPIEIALLGNLLLSKDEFDRFHLPTNMADFSKLMQTPKVLYTFFKNRVSHFRGADPRAFPRKTEHRVECVMSRFQRRSYMESIGHLEMDSMSESTFQRAFLIAPRQLSSLVLPNGSLGKLTVPEDFDVKKHSTKFHKCIQLIQRSPGPVFVYSNFLTVSGIEAFAQILSKVHNFSKVTKTTGKTPKLRYGIFRANQPVENAKLLNLYNSKENADGSIVKVILGSPTMKEGVTLLRTRQVHILDPYWNRSRTEQIIGRGVRFCSHADLPYAERHVDIFHYYAVPSDAEKELSVDLRILKLSQKKERKINIIETILKETAIDCRLFKDRNEPPTLHCFDHQLVSNRERNQLLSLHRNEKSPASPVVATVVSSPAAAAGPSTENTNAENQAPPPRKRPKPLQFGSTRVRVTRKKTKKSSCPVNRRPDDHGNCPAKFPFKRPNAKNDMCCYARNARTKAPRAPKECPPNKVRNPLTGRCITKK